MRPLGDKTDGRLINTRVLVVEDSPLISDLLSELLAEFGCEVIGPAPNMAVALKLAAEEAVDVAIIDVNIRGSKVFPVADVLADRGVPFLFSSGYASWAVPERHLSARRLQKPYTRHEIAAGLISVLRNSQDRST